MRIRRKKVVASFVLPVDMISEGAALHGLTTIRRKPRTSYDEEPDLLDDKESHYLKSKLWQVSPFLHHQKFLIPLPQVVWVLTHERRRNGKLHFVCFCSCLHGSTSRDCELRACQSLRQILTSNKFLSSL